MVSVKPSCSDAAGLNRAIQELCTGSGIVARLDIRTLVNSGKRQALCFLRIDSAAQQEQLMRTLELTRCGNDLLLIVDLPSAVPNASAPISGTAITGGR
jgi:hypothetical protein